MKKIGMKPFFKSKILTRIWNWTLISACLFHEIIHDRNCKAFIQKFLKFKKYINVNFQKWPSSYLPSHPMENELRGGGRRMWSCITQV